MRFILISFSFDQLLVQAGQRPCLYRILCLCAARRFLSKTHNGDAGKRRRRCLLESNEFATAMLTRCVNPGYFGFSLEEGGSGAGAPNRQPIGVRAASLDSSLEEGGSGAGAPKPQPVGVGIASLRPPIIGFHANQTKTARPRKQMPNEFNRPASVGPAPKKAPTANARMAIVTINLCATSNLPIRHSLDSWVPEGPWSAC